MSTQRIKYVISYRLLRNVIIEGYLTLFYALVNYYSEHSGNLIKNQGCYSGLVTSRRDFLKAFTGTVNDLQDWPDGVTAWLSLSLSLSAITVCITFPSHCNSPLWKTICILAGSNGNCRTCRTWRISSITTARFVSFSWKQRQTGESRPYFLCICILWAKWWWYKNQFSDFSQLHTSSTMSHSHT